MAMTSLTAPKEVTSSRKALGEGAGKKDTEMVYEIKHKGKQYVALKLRIRKESVHAY